MCQLLKEDANIWVNICPKYKKFNKTTNYPYVNIPFYEHEALLCNTTNLYLVGP